MNESLHISQAGLALIREFEGCYTRAYYDSVHVLTIGYGHTNMDGVPPKVVPGANVTKEQAEEILTRSLAIHYEPAVKRLVTVPLSQHEFDALVSFCYNCGEGNLSRLVRYLNKGQYDTVPGMLMEYTHAGGKVLNGLVRRRSAEAALWKSEPYANIVEEHKEDQRRPDVPATNEATTRADRPQELPDKAAKWGTSLAPFAAFGAFMTDWRVLAVLCVSGFVAAASYVVWKWKTQ